MIILLLLLLNGRVTVIKQISIYLLNSTLSLILYYIEHGSIAFGGTHTAIGAGWEWMETINLQFIEFYVELFNQVLKHVVAIIH